MCPRRVKSESLSQSFLSQLIGPLNWETTGFEQGVRDRLGQFGNRMTSFLQNDNNTSTIENVKNFARENKFTSMVVGICLLSVAFPIACFLGFAIVTLFIGLSSFVVIEGTLITVATLILASTLLAISLILGSIGMFFFSIYYVLTRLRNVSQEFVKRLVTADCQAAPGVVYVGESAPNGNAPAESAELVQSD